ncbi:pectinesterase 3-like [Impatiens glandulifera]|uniref:pectinesterase 3-like n=1 Tax=Impatiens glandulifera TaxID=253017 RepID=UPI001FB0AE0E|nr:pectinesterase 3-like [Impatiens glandulifera]
MDSFRSSFKSCTINRTAVDEPEDRVYRQKTRRRILILTISSAILVAMIVMTIICTRNLDTSPFHPPFSVDVSIKAMCSVTLYPNSCFSSLESSNTTDPHLLFKQTLDVSSNELSNLSTLPTSMIDQTNDDRIKAALSVCQHAFEDAISKMNDSVSLMSTTSKSINNVLSRANILDLETWLSAAVTDQETCLEALYEVNATNTIAEINDLMKNSTEFISNSLAIVSKVISFLPSPANPIHRRRRLLVDTTLSFPNWFGPGDRKLLQETNPKPDLVVAKDGSGDVKTIKEAIAKVPKSKNTTGDRFIIYVKVGEYVENVVLDVPNVMMYGDGKTNTVVSGSLNFVDGTPTFQTATFAVTGSGFIARDMGFKNTAGASKHQAVALRSGSDKSVFYRCSFEAFQDTLYTYSLRQFYRECDIIGTIDFIFGNAAVVFQNCNILPRQPMGNQFVTLTAQGKSDPNQNTGISIQKCVISPFDNLTATTYLGRPWKKYATTVVMQSQIGSLLDPRGWSPWEKNVEPPNTIYYAEYQNTGPGANTTNRVKWGGYKASITATEASRFTVNSFINGNSWLPATTVPFDSTL